MNNLYSMLWIAAAGISGAFIGMTRRDAYRTPLQRFVYLLSGLLVAFWLSPLLCKKLNLYEPEEISAVAFASGVFWSSILSHIGKLINSLSITKRDGS